MRRILVLRGRFCNAPPGVYAVPSVRGVVDQERRAPLKFNRTASARGVSFVAVAKALVPGIARRRGNPNWDKPAQFGPVLATEFEEEVHRLD
jgi:hypothetical protein